MDDTKVSAEAVMLAEAFGVALGGLATALKVKGLIDQETANSALFSSIGRIQNGQGISGTPEQRAAIAEAIKRTATI